MGDAESLVSVLGNTMDNETAQRLLEAAGGSVEAAVTRYFGDHVPGNVDEAPPSPRTALRNVIGPEGTDEQLAALLATAEGSVDAAADVFFTSGLPATGGGASSVRTRAPRQPAARRAPRPAPPARRSRQGSRSRNAPAKGSGAAAQPVQAEDAAGPSAPSSRMRKQSRAAAADEAPSESSTDGSSTDSEAVTDEGSGEAPDSASDDNSGEEGPSAPTVFPLAPAARGAEEDWTPSEEMLAEYEAAQTGDAPKRRRKTNRRSAQAAQHYFQAVARMTNMVVVPSSDSEDEPAGGRSRQRAPPAKKVKRKAGGARTSGLEAAWQALPDDGILSDPAPPIKDPVHQEDILNMEMLRESVKPTSRVRQKLPFESFRDESGMLFRRSCDASLPAHDLMLSTLEFPVHLGTFKLDLGALKATAGKVFKSRSQKLQFRAMEASVPGSRGHKVKEVRLRWPNDSYRLKNICRSAVLDVSHQETAKGPTVKLCSIGGVGHPLADLFGALSYLTGHGLVKLNTEAVASEAEGHQPRVELRLGVFLTEQALTLHGPFIGGPELYDGPKPKIEQDGDTRLKAQELRERGEMVQLLLHHLLLHGGGLSLGADCDGLLNFMDSDELLKQGAEKKAAGSAEGPDDAIPDPVTAGAEAGPAEGSSRKLEIHVGSSENAAPSATRKRHRTAADAEPGAQASKRRRSSVGNGAPSSSAATQPPKSSQSAGNGPSTRVIPTRSNPRTDSSLQAVAEAEILARLDADSGMSHVMMAGALDPSFPAADQPGEVETHAKRWQLQGLAWMLEREQSGDPLRRGNLHLHPCWLQFHTEDGQMIYLHRLQPHYISANFYAAPQGGTCGGFLADAMGLGKTLQMIMLVLKNPAPQGWAITDCMESKGVEWVYGEKPQLSLKTTLIVVPNNLKRQWLQELSKHLQPGALKWCTYSTSASEGKLGHRGKNAIAQLWGYDDGRNLVPLHECDVAVVTYEALMDELRRVKRPPLMQWGFWRLCLDEAQLVSRTNTQAAAAVSDIYRRHAWVVTGTPITSKLEEVQGLLAFLDSEPYYHSRPWNALLDREKNGAGRFALQPLFSLLRSLMLRRRKEDVGPDLELPPCQHEDWWLDLSKVEQAVYDAKRREMEGAVEQYIRSRHSVESNVRRHVNRCKKLLTDLRQACCDPQVVRTKEQESTKRRSMLSIMMDLVMKAFQAHDVALRGMLQAKLVLASVGPNAVAETWKAVDEMRLALIRSAEPGITELMGERGEDGAPLASCQNLAEASHAVVQTLRPEVDEFGTKVAWHVTFRRKKRAAREAAGLATPLGDEPDPRHQWQHEDQAEAQAKQAEDDKAADDGGAVKQREEARSAGDEAEDGADKRKQRAAAKRREGRTEADKLAKKAAEKERAARREAIKKRNADREALYNAWLERQAPPPVTEADIQEEELAKMAHTRIRAWTKTLLDATALHADLLERNPDPGSGLAAIKEDDDRGAGPSAAADPSGSSSAPCWTQARDQVNALRGLLGEETATVAALREEPRFSRRKRALEPEQEMQGTQYMALLQQHAAKERANNLLIAEMDKLNSRKHPERDARNSVSAASQQLTAHWRTVKRHTYLQQEVAAKEKGKSIAKPVSDDVEQDDIYTCPICTDLAERRTVTTCGHFFCSDCLQQALRVSNTCPLCRRPLSEADLFDAFTPDEAADAAERPQVSGEFSTKVHAVVAEVARMRAQRKGAKAVVFSTWSRLLRVVALALHRNGVPHASLATAQDQRSSSLETFQKDPDCSVLLVVLSTLGGAAGLTLTVADTVVLMEPSLWPGLESQAAGRIHRLGQTRETRVIRLLAKGTIEEGILQEQERKMSVKAADATMADVDTGTLLAVLKGHVQVPEPEQPLSSPPPPRAAAPGGSARGGDRS